MHEPKSKMRFWPDSLCLAKKKNEGNMLVTHNYSKSLVPYTDTSA